MRGRLRWAVGCGPPD